MRIVVARIAVRLTSRIGVPETDSIDGKFHYGTEFTCKKKRGLFEWVEKSNSTLAILEQPIEGTTLDQY